MCDALAQPCTQREIMQWRSIYANLGVETTGKPLFSNFGSHTTVDEDAPEVNDQLVQHIAMQFAQDVFNELSDDLQHETLRQSRTSKGKRWSVIRTRPEHVTPITTNRTSKIVKMNRLALMIPVVQHA